MTNIIRINDASEGIALYNAATHERNWLHMRLDTLIRDSITNSKWQAALFSFLSMFEYLSILIPYWHLSSEYFRREIKFGDLMQSIHAFSVMLNAMNIIVNNITTIASLSATSARVGGAITACYDIHKEHRLNLPTKIKTVVVQKPILSLDSLQCCVPGTDSIFLQSVNLRIEQNESLLIVGPSGCGKSSLLRVMAGLWNGGSGTVTRPHLKRCLFLPQKPYIPNLPIEFNTLRNQLLFPKFIDDQAVLQHNITSTQFNDQLMDDEDDDDSTIEAVTSPKTAGIRDTEILDVLDRVNMTHLGTYSEAGRLSPEHDPGALLYRTADWVNCLSIGEQQRLAIGRCLISKPDMIFVDEATSALDSSNQRAMYKALKELDVPVISVGHHWSLAKYHDFVLIFRGDGECETMSSAEYLHIPKTSIQSL